MLKTCIEIDGELVEVTKDEEKVLKRINLEDYAVPREKVCPTCGNGTLRSSGVNWGQIEQDDEQFVKVFNKLKEKVKINI